MEPRYNKVLGTMKITLLYQVSHYIRVKKQINIKSWVQQNYLVIWGFCYIRPLYNEVPLHAGPMQSPNCGSELYNGFISPHNAWRKYVCCFNSDTQLVAMPDQAFINHHVVYGGLKVRNNLCFLYPSNCQDMKFPLIHYAYSCLWYWEG